MQVSHETIYKSLFIQARGVLKRELIAHLRSRRVMRRGKTSKAEGQPRGQIIDAISIRQRPADIEDRAVPGHWEGDLISGSRNSHVATLVERHSRFVMLVHVNEQGQRQRRQCFNPAGPISTRRHDVVADLGSWNLHKRFTVATDADVFFCDPQSPWQLGPVRLLSGRSQRDRAQTQYTTAKNSWLSHPWSYLCQSRCIDWLNPPPLFLTRHAPSASGRARGAAWQSPTPDLQGMP